MTRWRDRMGDRRAPSRGWPAAGRPGSWRRRGRAGTAAPSWWWGARWTSGRAGGAAVRRCLGRRAGEGRVLAGPPLPAGGLQHLLVLLLAHALAALLDQGSHAEAQASSLGGRLARVHEPGPRRRRWASRSSGSTTCNWPCRPGARRRPRRSTPVCSGSNRCPSPSRWRPGAGARTCRGPTSVHLGVEEDFRPTRKAHPAFVVRDLPALKAALCHGGGGRPTQPRPGAGSRRLPRRPVRQPDRADRGRLSGGAAGEGCRAGRRRIRPRRPRRGRAPWAGASTSVPRPPGSFSAWMVPPSALTTWATIASPSPEPGIPISGRGAVEAVEHVGQEGLRARYRCRGRGSPPPLRPVTTTSTAAGRAG